MKVLVTGGGGFLGSAICVQLAARGDEVRSFNRSATTAAAAGIEPRRGDIANPGDVLAASAGVDAIVHSAGKVGAWGPAREYHDINVRGTDNVLAACAQHGIRKLVFTSSPSVVQRGSDIEGADESLPYPAHFASVYAQTKALAEQRVLAANGADLATVALRPHFIWGPGDPNLLPRVLARARAGRLRLIGKADKRVDIVHVDDAARAHVLALDKLHVGAPIAGKAYFISQGEPITHARLFGAWLAAAGLPAETRRIPGWLAHTLAVALEGTWRALGVRGEPPLTRFIVEEFSTSHWFDIAAARRDLGYAPQVGFEEGIRRLAQHLEDNRSAGGQKRRARGLQ
ncbi:MAG: NAD-dependent epimerase/dehydratase family protein [Proteobacteria bacterium]|uniref:NAD-dependent epimerase/dehydratase family protein n=1 Tax=Rudaea sp. TaxID=2136325 RepID=UPI001D582455|nr:NAD-dependent epimerase/dehydratase family protein [Pseudomonadota bacterium]MBS0568046.1 NAD-dependent epimerase/dehydratase family protein [Pseudomonadota bacterium]